MDYTSKIRITDGVENISGTVSMNNIFRYRNYRFYQGDFDNRNNEVYLLVSYDPYGIFFTYLGYLIFLITFPMFILIKKHSFSLSFGMPVLKRAAVSVTMLLYCFNAGAADKPKVLPQHLAEEFCDISVLYNGRVCPLQTLARDFTVKLYGKDSYKGYSAEQVMTGWMFFYQSWKSQPMIEIKSNRVRDILGTDERYVSYSQFISPLNEYKLASDKHTLPFSETAPANEKFNLIKNLCSGRMLRIFPVNDEGEYANWVTEWIRQPEGVIE